MKKLSNFFADLLFPINCFGCFRKNYYLCPECASKLPFYNNNRCSICNKISKDGTVCKECSKKSNIDQTKILYKYNHKLVKHLIYYLKYESAYLIARDLAFNLYKYFPDYFNQESFLVPIPMHPRKEKQRGYNQASILSYCLSKISNIKVVDDLLLKTVNTKPQMSILNNEERRKNALECYELDYDKITKSSLQREIILIDDIMTTGSTLESCAKVLKISGFKKVKTLLIARQVKVIN